MLVKRTLLQSVSVQIGEICTEDPATPIPDDEETGVPTPGGGGDAYDPCAIVMLEPGGIEIDGEQVMVLMPENPECGGAEYVTVAY